MNGRAATPSANGRRIAGFADPNVAIHVASDDSNGHSCRLDELFPGAFGLEPMP